MKETNIVKLPSILDKAIQNKSEDNFGHIHYAHVLFSIIENHIPPFSIGLLGQWGVGKSSIKKLCIEEFLNKEKDKYDWLDFNAWRYESEDVRRSLLKCLYEKLSGKKEEYLKQKLYSSITDNSKKVKSWNEIFEDLKDNVSIAIQIIFILIVFLISACIANAIFHFESNNTAIMYSVLMACTAYIAKFIFDKSGLLMSSYIPRTITTNPIVSSEQFEEIILELLKEKFQKKNKRKLVVFIDDLDRLSADKMINGLDAIRIFLDIKESDLIFVVSCYDEHIAKSITQTKTTFSNIDSARKYLDRVFQFKIDVPILPNQSMKSFALEHLKQLDSFKVFEKDIEKSSTYNINKILNILIPIEVSSPRAVIQILNSYMQAWWIAKQREEQCDLCNKEHNPSCPTDKECLLVKNIITSHLDILAIITVLKNQFPELYNDIIIEPQLLRFIMQKFFDLRNYEIADNTMLKLLAKKYVPENEENIYIFDKKYSNLQSYLASIQTIAIPDDIKPFIMLLQDNLERKIGGNSIPIYNSLITQNVTRFKDNLGITDETIEISELQTSQLNLVVQEINGHEDDDRREKAYIILSMFANLYKGEDAKLLINDISKTIVDKNFIKNIESSYIEKLLDTEYISDVNINKVYSYLIATVKNGKVITQKASENQYKKVIEIGLEQHYTNKKLDKNNTKNLIKLLNDGIYKYKNAENESSFVNKIDVSFYIENIKTYGKALLDDLTLNYVDDLLEFLNNAEEDVESYILHIDYIISNTTNVKPKELENTISKGLANNNIKIINYFEKLIFEENAFNKVDKALIPEIIDSYAQRIIKYYVQAVQLENLENVINNLISMINLCIKLNGANNIIESSISSLVNILANESTPLFDKLFSKYGDLFPEKAENILNKLVKNIFITDEISEEETIKTDLLILLAQKYIKEKQIEILSKILENVFEDYTNTVDDKNSERYYQLLYHLDKQNHSNEIFIQHISNMYEALELAISNDYEDYFDTLFDSVAQFFDIIKTSTLNSFLSYIITEHLVDETDKTEKLYASMKDVWPHEDKEKLPSYNVINIAENMLKLLKDSNVTIDKKVAFESIYSIFKNKIENSYDLKCIITNSLMYLWNKHTEYAYKELLNFNDIMIKRYYHEWLSPRTPAEYHYLLEKYWQDIFKIADETWLTKRTENFIAEYKNTKDKDLWCKLIYERFGNLNILSKVSAQQIIKLNKNFIEQCKFITDFIVKNYNDDIQKEYGKSLLINGYILVDDDEYKKEILTIAKKLIDKEAKGVFSKSDFKNSKNIKLDVDKLQKAFNKNRALLSYRKELFSRKRKNKQTS